MGTKRKLPDLPNTATAVRALNSEKNRQLFSNMKVYDSEELKARQTNMYDAYTQIIEIEANVMVKMLETGVIPACATDLKTYEGPVARKLIGERETVYSELAERTLKLKNT